MPGWTAMPPAADPPRGERLALVVATSTYTDPGLRRLRAPARDAADLAQVLADPDIGGFTVITVIDQSAQQVRLAVEDFLDGRGTGDLLLVYLSCHGLLDARRRLYFAAADTRKDRLGATGVESAWVMDQWSTAGPAARSSSWIPASAARSPTGPRARMTSTCGIALSGRDAGGWC